MPEDDVNKDALEAHNRFRAAHGCPRLVYNSGLARSAQNWANEIAKSGNMRHSNDKSHGENLAYRWSSAQVALSGAEAAQMWYDEIKFHDFNGQFQPKSGHFTQLIWKDSKSAGFGRAMSADGHSVYVVGHYSPPGNVMGKFADNVPRAIKEVKPATTVHPAREIKPKEKKTKDKKCTIL
ncbi:unnamed protein product [Calicophoron daubneyi]|uniref:SCP domain-containing protein n=1 Tax=Calicophoron daubneyi TaxID=300641 RepID=A0AAV2TER9_CALDB